MNLLTARINPWHRFYFAAVPNWLLSRTSVIPGVKLCYAVLVRHAGEKGYCWPSQQTLANDLGVGVRNIQKYVRKLRELKLVETEKRGIDQPNNYYFLEHPWMSDDSGGGEPQDVTKTNHSSPRKRTTVRPNKIIEKIQLKDNTYLSDWESDSSVTLEEFVRDWNEDFKGELSAITLPLSKSRKGKLLARLKEHPGREFWETVFTKIGESQFLLGQTENKNGHENWRCTLDFVIANDTNCLKIYEGAYSHEKE